MFNKIVNLFLENDDLGHCLEATFIMIALLPFVLITNAPFILLFVYVMAWFHGREKAQFELKLKQQLGLQSVIGLWYKGWFPWEWGADARRDLIIPAIYSLLISIGLMYFF